MNFSIDSLNDTLVLVLQERVTPTFKGFTFYPLPLLDLVDSEALENTITSSGCDEDTDNAKVKRHVVINHTNYSNRVAMKFARNAGSIVILSCDYDIQKYILDSFEHADYETISSNDVVKDIFETIDPLQIAKYCDLISSKRK